MAMTTKRLSTASKSKSTQVKKVAPDLCGSVKARSAKAGPPRIASAKAAAHILPAAKGPRTISHRKIKEAVDKVFRERSHARA